MKIKKVWALFLSLTMAFSMVTPVSAESDSQIYSDLLEQEASIESLEQEVADENGLAEPEKAPEEANPNDDTSKEEKVS